MVESAQGSERLQLDMLALAVSTLPDRPDNWEELPFPDRPPVNAYPDVIFRVGDRHFFCHKVKNTAQ